MSNVSVGVDPEFGTPDPPLPHWTHNPGHGWSCLDCGAETREQIEAPCPNVRCENCGELNGFISPGCLNHGEDRPFHTTSTGDTVNTKNPNPQPSVEQSAEQAISQRGPLVIWATEDGFSHAWGRLPSEEEQGYRTHDTLEELLGCVGWAATGAANLAARDIALLGAAPSGTPVAWKVEWIDRNGVVTYGFITENRPRKLEADPEYRVTPLYAGAAPAERGERDERLHEYERRKLAYTEAMLGRIEHRQDNECNACAAETYTGHVCPEYIKHLDTEEAAESALDAHVVALAAAPREQPEPGSRVRVVEAEDCEWCGAVTGEPCHKKGRPDEPSNGPHIVRTPEPPAPGETRARIITDTTPPADVASRAAAMLKDTGRAVILPMSDYLALTEPAAPTGEPANSPTEQVGESGDAARLTGRVAEIMAIIGRYVRFEIAEMREAAVLIHALYHTGAHSAPTGGEDHDDCGRKDLIEWLERRAAEAERTYLHMPARRYRAAARLLRGERDET